MKWFSSPTWNENFDLDLEQLADVSKRIVLNQYLPDCFLINLLEVDSYLSNALKVSHRNKKVLELILNLANSQILVWETQFNQLELFWETKVEGSDVLRTNEPKLKQVWTLNTFLSCRVNAFDRLVELQTLCWKCFSVAVIVIFYHKAIEVDMINS